MSKYRIDIKRLVRPTNITIYALLLTGCNSIFPEIHDGITQNDIDMFHQQLYTDNIYRTNLKSISWRRDYVTMKMYEIDRSYEAYWHDIDSDDTFISFGGDIVQLGLTTTGAAIPVTQTTKILSAAATAVGASKGAYKQEFLMAKTKEAIRVQADKNRISVGKTIIARLNCKLDAYPWGMVLSDIDSYKNAGTFEAALNSIAQSVSASQPAASASTGKATPVTVSATPALSPPADGGGAAKAAGAAAQNANKGTIPIAGGKLDISFTPNSSCPLKSGASG
jgi:hypothetical protein